MKKLILLLLFALPASADVFVYGSLGVGAYSHGMGRPDITTPNMLGDIQFGVGKAFENDVDLRFGFQHWSSMQGFPDIFDSPGEDGRGFNALWLKVEKRFYLE